MLGDEDPPGGSRTMAVPPRKHPLEHEGLRSWKGEGLGMAERVRVAPSLAPEGSMCIGVVAGKELEGDRVEVAAVVHGLATASASRVLRRQPMSELVQQGVAGVIGIASGGDGNRAGVGTRQAR